MDAFTISKLWTIGTACQGGFNKYRCLLFIHIKNVCVQLSGQHLVQVLRENKKEEV